MNKTELTFRVIVVGMLSFNIHLAYQAKEEADSASHYAYLAFNSAEDASRHAEEAAEQAEQANRSTVYCMR